MKKDQTDYFRSQFRLPWALYERLEANRTSKSLNAEIVARLEASFERDKRIERLEQLTASNSEALQQCLAILNDLIKQNDAEKHE